MNSTFRRSTLALATVVACLALLASPVSANPTHSATITGGTVNVSAPATAIPLGGGGGGGGACAAGTVTIGHDTTPTPHGVDITALSTTGEFALGGNTWVAQISRVSSVAGTHSAPSGGSGTVSNVKLRVTAVVRGPITPGTCDTTAAVRCTLTNSAVGQELNFSGTWTDVNASGDIDNTDTSVVSAATINLAKVGACFSPFTTVTTANVANLALTLTS